MALSLARWPGLARAPRGWHRDWGTLRCCHWCSKKAEHGGKTEGGEAGIHEKGDEEDRSCEKAIQTKDDEHHWHQKAATQGRQKADAEAWSYFSKIAPKKKVTGVKAPWPCRHASTSGNRNSRLHACVLQS